MGWRSVIITQHAKLSYSAHMMRSAGCLVTLKKIIPDLLSISMALEFMHPIKMKMSAIRSQLLYLKRDIMIKQIKGRGLIR